MILGQDNKMRSQSRFSPTNTILSRTVNTEATKSSLRGAKGLIRETVEGVDYLTAYNNLQFEGIDWTIVTRVTTAEALKSINELTRTTYWVAGISAILVALFAFFLGRLKDGNVCNQSLLYEAVKLDKL